MVGDEAFMPCDRLQRYCRLCSESHCDMIWKIACGDMIALALMAAPGEWANESVNSLVTGIESGVTMM